MNLARLKMAVFYFSIISHRKARMERFKVRISINFMDSDSIIKFAEVCGKLKKTLRTGWVNRKIKNPESVAEHCWRAAVLCLVLADKNLDKNKLVKMAVVHDLEEALTGDIITKEKEANAEVSKRNATEAMKKISAVIGGAE